ncbi:MAG: hypothetical protein AB1489_39890, partial [Acidobacteriota bacterium]
SCVPTAVVNINSDDIYTVTITANNNTITHTIKPESGPQIGRETNIGVFVDENSLFPYGNIGFRTVAGEEIMIDDFHIAPLDSAVEKLENR